MARAILLESLLLLWMSTLFVQAQLNSDDLEALRVDPSMSGAGQAQLRHSSIHLSSKRCSSLQLAAKRNVVCEADYFTTADLVVPLPMAPRQQSSTSSATSASSISIPQSAPDG